MTLVVQTVRNKRVRPVRGGVTIMAASGDEVLFTFEFVLKQQLLVLALFRGEALQPRMTD